jgi:hypothetical protein
MAFGIPGTESSSSGGNNEFLGRLQFDARSGLWKHVTRMEEGGRYFNSESEDYMNPSFLMDFGSLEVGYAKLNGIPSFALVPFGALMPQWSEELNPEGKRAYTPAARIKVLSPKTFGDDSPRYFLLNSKTGLPAMQEAWIAFAACPEAASGMIPVAQTSVKTVEVKTPGGLSKFKVPVFNFIAWIERPASLGERITAVPDPSTGLPMGARVLVAMGAPASTPVAAAPAPTNHVPAPAPVAVAAPPPAPVAASAAAPW